MVESDDLECLDLQESTAMKEGQKSLFVKCLEIVGAMISFAVIFFLFTAGLLWGFGEYFQFEEEFEMSYSGPGLIVSSFTILTFTTISLMLVARIFRSFRDLARPAADAWDYTNISKGVLVGCTMISIPFFIVIIFGLVSISKVELEFQGLVYSFAALLFAAAFEEVLCRSFLLQTVGTFFSSWTAIISSAAIFGIGHLLNDNISILSIVELFLAGLVLGVFYVKYGLGAAISFHFIWNFLQGPIYGFRISGTEGYHLLELLFLNQNDMLSGIHFGLEGTIWAVMVSVAYLSLVLYQDGRNLGRKSSNALLRDGKC